jgi:hypothetical protein
MLVELLVPLLLQIAISPSKVPFRHIRTSIPDSRPNWQVMVQFSPSATVAFSQSLVPNSGLAKPAQPVVFVEFVEFVEFEGTHPLVSFPHIVSSKVVPSRHSSAAHALHPVLLAAHRLATQNCPDLQIVATQA